MSEEEYLQFLKECQKEAQRRYEESEGRIEAYKIMAERFSKQIKQIKRIKQLKRGRA